jgi:hypothetical protein
LLKSRTVMRRVGTAGVMVLVAIAASSAFAATRETKPVSEEARCGGVVLEGIGAYAIRARQIDCRHGRNLAMRWMATSSCGRSVCAIGRFSCWERSLPSDALHVRCLRKPALVSFQYGTVTY